VIVGTTFKELVIDSNKDVMVMFYAPWCGHCKNLMPQWEKLADELKDVKDLMIAKIDDTANEGTGIKVKGYPMIKFFKKDVIGTGKVINAKFDRS
jgi:protein disulfide-isomerase A1